MRKYILNYLKALTILVIFLTSIVSHTVSATPVPGWATDHITMGTATDGGQMDALKQRPVESVFTYAGINGGGDRGIYIETDKKIKTIMDQSRELEKTTGKKIQPVIVVYTVNGSDGVWSIQQDLDLDKQTPTQNLKFHFANLIRICQLLESYRDENHPTPATIILNPDFLGELHKQCGPWYCPISLDEKINLKQGLLDGLKMAGATATIPEPFQKPDTKIADYIQSINWLVQTFAPHVPFAWQDNVWAGDESGHVWIHKAAQHPELVNEHIQKETTFLQQMQVFAKPYPSQFIVFDKWERDEFDSTLKNAGLNNGYLYNVADWDVYMQFVNGISHYFSDAPIMLWQIPGGHLQIKGDIDNRKDHASTAPDYFLGDNQLTDDLSNAESYIQDATLKPESYAVTSNRVLDYLKCPTNNPHCWQKNRLNTSAMKQVFAILWGGGSTTGIIKFHDLDDAGWLWQNTKFRVK